MSSSYLEAMSTRGAVVLSPDLYFSYRQFIVYDKGLQSPACDWTDAHCRQGFARRHRTIAVGTLMEFGTARVVVHFVAPSSITGFQRVIAVPLDIMSVQLGVDGPDEYPIERGCSVPSGYYRVYIAQKVTGEDREEVEIFLERTPIPIHKSQILVADEQLDPPSELVESAEQSNP